MGTVWPHKAIRGCVFQNHLLSHHRCSSVIARHGSWLSLSLTSSVSYSQKRQPMAFPSFPFCDASGGTQRSLGKLSTVETRTRALQPSALLRSTTFLHGSNKFSFFSLQLSPSFQTLPKPEQTKESDGTW